MWPQPPVLLSTTWILAVLPTRSDRSQFAQSSCSLLAPVVVRTTLPSTSRLTAVSIDTGTAASGEKTMLSTLMWPQPPVLVSTIWICACCPCQLAVFQATQFRASLSWPVAVATTLPPTSRLTAVGSAPGAGLAVYGWFPPPTSR